MTRSLVMVTSYPLSRRSGPFRASILTTLPDIYVPPHHQPINPEDEDDVIPDQHGMLSSFLLRDQITILTGYSESRLWNYPSGAEDA